MEATYSLEALRKLQERLCRETEPSKLYKTLKKLSSLPILCDVLAEIDFRQTIKLLRKGQLLVPFAQDLAAQWSEGTQCGPEPEAGPQDFAFQRSLRAETPSKSPEDKLLEPTSREQRPDGRDFLQESSSSPQMAADPSPGALAPRKRKRKSTRRADAQSPAAKSPRGESPSPKDPNLWAAGPFAEEVPSRGQACFFPLDGQEPSSPHRAQEAGPWTGRRNAKTPVYSGRAPAGPHPLQPNCQPARLAKPQDCTWERTGCQGAEAGEAEPLADPGQPTASRTWTETHLQLHESRELCLQALRARIQSAQAKKLQGRQSQMIAFHAQATSPGQLQAHSRPRGAASAQQHSLPEASAHRLPLGSSRKSLAKKPAPLMAKALRDYRNRFSRR